MGSCPDTDIDVRAARRLMLSNRELEKYTSAAFDVLWRRIKAGIPGPMLPARVANQITGFILVVVGASSAIRADEELTLETLALILFTVANLHYQLG